MTPNLIKPPSAFLTPFWEREPFNLLIGHPSLTRTVFHSCWHKPEAAAGKWAALWALGPNPARRLCRCTAWGAHGPPGPSHIAQHGGTHPTPSAGAKSHWGKQAALPAPDNHRGGPDCFSSQITRLTWKPWDFCREKKTSIFFIYIPISQFSGYISTSNIFQHFSLSVFVKCFKQTIFQLFLNKSEPRNVFFKWWLRFLFNP